MKTLLFSIALFVSPFLYSSEKPNILFILTDDQGWPTLGCYGGKIVPTPHLDQLAAEGARFSDFYVTSQCSPTRASFLTGQYTARNGLWHVLPWYGYPYARMTEPIFLENYSRETFTVAKGLRTAGYTTGIAGKWHLTNNQDGNYAGLNPDAAHHYGFDWAAPVLNNKELIGEPDADRGVEFYTENAIDFITENRDEPWFLYLSHHTIHGVVVAPDDLTRKYRDLGYTSDVTGPNRAVYLAALEHIDHSVGRLLRALDDLGEAENTLVIFTSDNGGIHHRFDFRSQKGGDPDYKPNLIEYSNAPLRMGKGSIYEGGTRVPFIVRWPGNIKPGTVIDSPAHMIDMMPTFFDLAGVKCPANHVLDGVSLQPLFRGQASPQIPNRPIFQYCPFYDLNWGLTPSASIRKGDYKLIEFFGDRFSDGGKFHEGHRVELYNLREDLWEKNNLAPKETELTHSLQAELHQWMNEIQAETPERNPHFDPDRAFEVVREKPGWIEGLKWSRN